MLALALAGVYGDSFEYIILAVAGFAGVSVYLCRHFQQRDKARPSAWLVVSAYRLFAES
ncbi:hypothetical protein [Pseudomonas purpurea]|uniref:hypothetical protein n=1 Tax=Pseudomonas purpurea TaxID=3136737 RepID=UPI00326595C6